MANERACQPSFKRIGGGSSSKRTAFHCGNQAGPLKSERYFKGENVHAEETRSYRRCGGRVRNCRAFVGAVIGGRGSVRRPRSRFGGRKPGRAGALLAPPPSQRLALPSPVEQPLVGL